MARRKFEYRVEEVATDLWRLGADAEAEELNALGALGWELVSVSRGRAYLRREVPAGRRVQRAREGRG
jgi:hypothetical protein